MSKSRQLAAIMFTDIVGFTALMGNDEQKTFEILEMNRQIHKPIITEYNGRWIKELGDGVMATFINISDAINAATKIMEACNAANEYQLCIGIHASEVVFEHDDVFGDGVNIAARIQSAAPAGCIFISEIVENSITNKKGIQTNFYKEVKLKNVVNPIRLHQVLIKGSEIAVAKESPSDNKSIAVLPFVNMSSDPEQEYFSDGISEEIINMLAQVPKLKVMGRTSSFAFKGKNMDLKLIGEQLNVSYILEGSVRKSGNKLRITAQLINVTDGAHMYSEKFDRELEDIFEIQDEISLKILHAIKIKLFGSDKDAVFKKYTDNIEAYELYLNGRFHYNNQYSKEGFLKAIDYFKKAIEIEPDYSIAYAEMGYCYMTLAYWNWLPVDQSLPLSRKAVEKSIELDDQIAESHLALGRLILHHDWNIRDGIIEFKKALDINPNNPEIYGQLGMAAALSGKSDEAIAYANKAIGLDPLSVPNLFIATTSTMGDAQRTLEIAKQLIELAPNFYAGYWLAGINYMALERYEEGLNAYQTAINFGNEPNALATVGMTYGFMGEKAKAMEVLERIKNIEGIELYGNCFIGDVYLGLGDLDTAFMYYDKAIENKEGFMLWKPGIFRSIPGLMEDPRAIQMIKKMGVIY